MAKILVQFNETTAKATSQGNLDDRMISFFTDGTSEGFAYRKVDDTFLTFSSDEHISNVSNDFASSVGINWSGTATDVNGAIEEVKSLVTSFNDTLNDADGDTTIQVEATTDDDNIVFTNAGSESARIDASGLFSIGVASNSSYLTLKENTTALSTLQIKPSAAVDVAAPNSGDIWWNGTNLYFYDGSANQDLLDTGTGDIVNGGQNGAVTIGTNDASVLIFETNNSARMQITSTGHLTYFPFAGATANLVTSDTGGVVENNSNFIVSGGSLGLGASPTGPGSGQNLYIKGSGTNSVGIRLERTTTGSIVDLYASSSDSYVGVVGGSSARPFSIKYYDGASDQTGIYIASDGDIGIGTTSPDNHLDIEKSEPRQRFTATRVDDARNWEIGAFYNAAQTSNNFCIVNQTLGSTVLYINKDNRMGIGGIPLAGRDLHITDSDTLDAVNITFTNGSSGQTATDGFLIGIDNSATPNAELVNFESSSMIFKTSNTERMSISSAGVLQVKDLITTDGTGSEQMVISDDQGDLDTSRLPGGNCFETGNLATANTELSITYNTPHYVAVYVNRKTRISKISFFIWTSSGSTQFRCALYDSSRNKVDEGTVTTSSTGIVTANLSGSNVSANALYYLAILKVTNNATTFASDNAAAISQTLTFQGASSSTFPATESTTNNSARAIWLSAS